MVTVEENIAADRLREETARAEFGAFLIFISLAGVLVLTGGIIVIFGGLNFWSILCFLGSAVMCFLSRKLKR